MCIRDRYKGTNNGLADVDISILVLNYIHMILLQEVIDHRICLIGEHIHTADGNVTHHRSCYEHNGGSTPIFLHFKSVQGLDLLSAGDKKGSGDVYKRQGYYKPPVLRCKNR